ncbi:MAG: DUF6526 family protein [Gemmatimonadales bacterium]
MSDTPQTYKNHTKIVFGFHRVASLLLLLLLIWSVRSVILAPSLDSAARVATVVVLGLLFWYARTFPLKVQDRVIRLEEQLRLARVLPEEMRSRISSLTMGQYIALRFAPDGELPDLVRRIIAGDLATPDSIKQAIKDWRPDHYRV